MAEEEKPTTYLFDKRREYLYKRRSKTLDRYEKLPKSDEEFDPIKEKEDFELYKKYLIRKKKEKRDLERDHKSRGKKDEIKETERKQILQAFPNLEVNSQRNIPFYDSNITQCLTVTEDFENPYVNIRRTTHSEERRRLQSSSYLTEEEIDFRIKTNIINTIASVSVDFRSGYLSSLSFFKLIQTNNPLIQSVQQTAISTITLPKLADEFLTKDGKLFFYRLLLTWKNSFKEQTQFTIYELAEKSITEVNGYLHWALIALTEEQINKHQNLSDTEISH